MVDVKISKKLVYFDIFISALLSFIFILLLMGYTIPKFIIIIMFFVEFLLFLSSLITLDCISNLK